jgi:hypothetical protein
VVEPGVIARGVLGGEAPFVGALTVGAGAQVWPGVRPRARPVTGSGYEIQRGAGGRGMGGCGGVPEPSEGAVSVPNRCWAPWRVMPSRDAMSDQEYP